MHLANCRGGETRPGGLKENDMSKCVNCDGCGKIADDDDGAPWSMWLSLPVQSSIAIQMGWVKPIDCPECGGTGKENVE